MDDGADAEGRQSPEPDEAVLRPANAEVPEPSDVEALRETKAETRAILDYRLRSLDEIDEKAMRTVRTAVVVLGVLISGVGVAGPSRIASVDPWPARFVVLGVGFLLGSILGGIAIATDSAVDPGPDDRFRGEVREQGYSEDEWLVLLLDGYDEWIETARRAVDANATRLLFAQVALACAFLAFLAAVGLSVVPN